MKPDYDSILPLFFDAEDRNPGFRQPNTTGDFVWATDRHVLVTVPRRLLRKDYPSHEKAPRVEPVLAATHLYDNPVPLKTRDLMAILAQIPKEKQDKWVACPECEGSGGEECFCCGHTTKCEHCDGEGEVKVEDSLAPLVYPFEGYGIGIGKAVFSPLFVGVLEAVLAELDAPEFLLAGGAENRQHLFRIGEVDVILMPKMEEAPVFVLA
jgi:hypothetical protein